MRESYLKCIMHTHLYMYIFNLYIVIKNMMTDEK